ncbi:phage tail protein [Achromobacter xylosoxidans]|uniref:phage tail protein n=1 Tax=Alcaligenes xylosoxydans xylosoxydans TaxID=85698 RepID=UPI001177D141|nr:phage tail protein [Achromobacter xylosoxidans]
MDYPKSVPGVGLVAGRFVNEDPIAGRAGSLIPAEWGNAVTDELLAVIRGAEFSPSEADNTQLLYAIRTLIANAVAYRPLIYGITELPDRNVGPIVVLECSEIWIWTATSSFVGYRSPLCGRPLDGHTLTPLAGEVDAVGGLLPKVAYARLWGYARENGLVVSQGTWSANLGAHYFVDVDANYFRVPDLRNMHRRYTGTDADSGNARTLGSRQSDALQRITGSMQLRPDDTGGAMILNNPIGAFDVTPSGGTPNAARMVSSPSPLVQNLVTLDSSRVTRSASETRALNAAYYPRIHT